jgi:hypothetical protein
LISSILRFFQSVAANDPTGHAFDDKLQTVFEKLIYPNLLVTKEDYSRFETVPDKFIADDLEDSNQRTLRQRTWGLLGTLSPMGALKTFLTQVIQAELSKYEQDRKLNWTAKVTALSLFMGMHALQCPPYIGGTISSPPTPSQTPTPTPTPIPSMTTAETESVCQVLTTYAFPELETLDEQGTEAAFLKAVSLKFLIVFRSCIPPAWVPVLCETIFC